MYHCILSIVRSRSQSIAKKIPPPINKIEDSEYQREDEPGYDINPFGPGRKLGKKSHGATANEAYEYATYSGPQ